MASHEGHALVESLICTFSKYDVGALVQVLCVPMSCCLQSLVRVAGKNVKDIPSSTTVL